VSSHEERTLSKLAIDVDCDSNITTKTHKWERKKERKKVKTREERERVTRSAEATGRSPWLKTPSYRYNTL